MKGFFTNKKKASRIKINQNGLLYTCPSTEAFRITPKRENWHLQGKIHFFGFEGHLMSIGYQKKRVKISIYILFRFIQKEFVHY